MKSSLIWGKRILRIIMTICVFVSFCQESLATHQDGKRHSALERFAGWSDFVNRWNAFADNGQQLIDFFTIRDEGKTWYIGAWQMGKGSGALFRYDNWSDFVKKYHDLKNSQRLLDIDISKEGKTWFTGTWHVGEKSGALYRYDSWSEFVKKWKQLNDQGLGDLEVIQHGANTWFYGAWEPGRKSGALYRYGSWAEFTKKREELNKEGQRLIDVEIDRKGKQVFYTGVWKTGNGASALFSFSSWQKIHSKWLELDWKGYYLVDIEAFQDGSNVNYIGVWRHSGNPIKRKATSSGKPSSPPFKKIPGCHISGKITGESKYVGSMGLQLRQDRSKSFSAKINNNKTYQFSNIPVGEWVLSPFSGGKFSVVSNPESKTVNCKSGNKIQVNFQILGISEG